MKTLSQSHCHRSPAPSSEREYTGELQRASDAECKRSARSRQDDYTQQSTPNSGFRNLTVAPPPRRPADDFRTLLVNPCVSLGAAQIPCARAPTWGPTPEGGRFSDADHTKPPFSRQSLCTRAARRAPTRCACRPAPCADLLRAPTRSVRRPAPCTDPAAPQADPTPAHYCAPAHRPNADPLLRARPLRAPAARQPLCTPDSTTRRSALHVSSTACVGPRPTDGQTDSTVSPQAAAESMLSRRGMRTTIEFCASGTCTDSTCVLWVAVGAHPIERDRAVPARRSCLKPATHGVMAEHVLDEHQNRGRIGGIDARGQAGADNRLGRASSEHAQR